MVQIVELLVVFTLSLNLFAGMVVTSGVDEDIGLEDQLNVGGDEAVDRAVNNASEVKAGAPTGSTLFGMYNVIARTLKNIGKLAYAAPMMLWNMGVPSFITTPLAGLITVIYGISIIKFFRGMS